MKKWHKYVKSGMLDAYRDPSKYGFSKKPWNLVEVL